MAFAHGKDTALIHDSVDWQPYMAKFKSTSTIELADVTPFGEEDRSALPGIAAGEVALTGFFNGDAAPHTQLATARGAALGLPMSVGINGFTILNRVLFGTVREADYQIVGSVGDAVGVTAKVVSDDGWDHGVSLHTLEAETSAGNEATHWDFGAASTTAGVACLHITAFTGTDITVAAQHSANDADWADAVAFTQATDVGSEIIEDTGTINRYMRAEWDGTFDTCTFQVSYARW